MNYLILFLEGIITFISPCLLPMLPVYISYFAGYSPDSSKSTLKNSIGFVIGFTIVFITLGAFAGTAGSFLKDHISTVNIVSGIIVILLGLNFLEIIKIPFINTNRTMSIHTVTPGFFTSIIFGIVFSISWTPCVGAFLGSALMLAASTGGSVQGIIMLLCFSMGLGIPFIASALLIDKMKNVFDFIKKNYRIVNLISGGLLILIGFMMASGFMGYFLSVLTFSD